jgi:pimeloyl-ACP methyl ester carboxylesterase
MTNSNLGDPRTRRQALGMMAAGITAPLVLGGGAARAVAADATPASGVAKAPVVLVHGAFLGAWCWDEVIPRLAAAGHEVAAPDLPGHGADDTPLAEITHQ